MARLAIISLAIVASILTFVWLFGFMIQIQLPGSNALSSASWTLLFRGPAILLYGFVPMAGVIVAAELLGFRRWRSAIVIWVAAGLLVSIASWPTFDVALAGAAASFVAGNLYWLIAIRPDWKRLTLWSGQGSARPGRSLLLRAPFYAVLAVLAWQFMGYLQCGGKLVWVTYVAEPGPGEPPFRSRRPFTATQKVALMDFPDADSCLKPWPGATAKRLEDMDWSRINNKHEAEICVFRLLASYKNCDAAGGWFEAQGLRIDKASSRLRRTGNGCDITGTWPTHKNGPRFPTHWSPGWLVTKIFVWGTSISAMWSKDGKELMFINIVDTVF